MGNNRKREREKERRGKGGWRSATNENIVAKAHPSEVIRSFGSAYTPAVIPQPFLAKGSAPPRNNAKGVY